MMTELEAVYQRHSVRSFLDRPVEPEKLATLGRCIDACNREGCLRLQLLGDAGGTFQRLLNRAMGQASAPSAIACVGPDDATLDERAGYYGERVVLLAQQLGLNTCWSGTYNARKVPVAVSPGERLVIVIALGYGANPGKPRRSRTPAQVVRNYREDLPAWFTRGVELALLAPTALNQQKFEFSLNADGAATVADNGGPFSRVDLGIVKYHFDLGAREILGNGAPSIL